MTAIKIFQKLFSYISVYVSLRLLVRIRTFWFKIICLYKYILIIILHDNAYFCTFSYIAVEFHMLSRTFKYKIFQQ